MNESRVIEVNNYYPYGMLNKSMSWQLSGNNYKYQSKEMQKYFDYNVLDFGARHYDAAIARWTVPDPAGQYFNLYYAMGGNPVSMVDPDGMWNESYHANPNSNDYSAGDLNHASFVDGGRPWQFLGSGVGGAGGASWTGVPTSVASYNLQHGNTYEQQAINQVCDLAALGGYVSGDGSIIKVSKASGRLVVEKPNNGAGYSANLGYWAALQNGELTSVSGISYPEVVSTRIGVLMSESDYQKTGSYWDGVFWYGKYQDESNPQYTAFREGGDIAAKAAMLLVPMDGLGIVASKGLSFGARFINVSTKAGEAVFYAGDGAMAAAQSFAKANGKATLDMRLGKSLYSFLKLFGSDINSEAFNILSTNFAKGSSGSNTIFIGNYVNSSSTFLNYEYPVLINRVSSLNEFIWK